MDKVQTWEGSQYQSGRRMVYSLAEDLHSVENLQDKNSEKKKNILIIFICMKLHNAVDLLWM